MHASAPLLAGDDDMRRTPEELVAGITDLVSLPDVYLRVRAVTDDPDSSIGDLAEVVSSDPALSARLLKLANSAFFGFTTRIDTVERAANLLGTRQIQDLVLATTVADAFSKVKTTTLNMREFWASSLHCGLLSKLLGSHCGIADFERFFVQGLLHRIGDLVIDQSAAQAYSMACERAAADDRFIWEVQQELLGCSYAEVGATLMASWNFPPNLIEAVAYHNEPNLAVRHPLDAAIVHVASVLIAAPDENQDAAALLAMIDPFAIDTTGVDADMLGEIIEEATSALSETFEMLFPEA